MVEVKDAEIFDRETMYVADEIFFLNYVISDYSQPIAPEPKNYAENEYDKTTSTLE
jgi:hypothetical protein